MSIQQTTIQALPLVGLAALLVLACWEYLSWEHRRKKRSKQRMAELLAVGRVLRRLDWQQVYQGRKVTIERENWQDYCPTDVFYDGELYLYDHGSYFRAEYGAPSESGVKRWAIIRRSTAES